MKKMITNNENHRKMASLRLLAGFLGENGNFGWWDTQFLSATGLRFLAIDFPRTAFVAGYHGVVSAARRLHDDRIGKDAGVFHLFRLPAGVEEDLHRAVMEADPETDFLPLLASRDAALKILTQWAGNSRDASEGPVRLGTWNNMASGLDLERIAAFYANAFRDERQCFPYFKVQESESA
jgi:hypothetical protein